MDERDYMLPDIMGFEVNNVDKSPATGILVCPGKFQYHGEIKDGKPNGHGTISYVNGTKYVGKWQDGALSGNAICHFANGDSYVGHIRDGKAHGIGILSWASGESWSGEWRNGVYHVHGIKHSLSKDESPMVCLKTSVLTKHTIGAI